MITDKERIAQVNDHFHAKNYRMKMLGFRYAEADGYGSLIRDDGYTALPSRDTILIQHASPHDYGENRDAVPGTRRSIYVANRTTITFLDLAAHAPHTHLAMQKFAWKINKHGIYTGEITVDVLNADPTAAAAPDGKPFDRGNFSEIGNLRLQQGNGQMVYDEYYRPMVPRYTMTGMLNPIAPPPGYDNVIAAYDWRLQEATPCFAGTYIDSTLDGESDEMWDDETP
jgi:hypothetical protein